MDLKEKNVIVTGGVKGIGHVVVGKLLREGAGVCVFDVDTAGLDRLKETNPEVRCIQCDITDCGQVEESVDAFFREAGRIDVLVNNAGILYSAPLVSLTSEGIRKHDTGLWEKRCLCRVVSAIIKLFPLQWQQFSVNPLWFPRNPD